MADVSPEIGFLETTPTVNDIVDDLRRARRGDSEALGRVLARYQRPLLAQARRRMAGLEGKLRPSDILQSTFVDAVKYVDSLRDETDAGVFAWLMSILDNNVRDRRKYFKAEKRGAVLVDQIEEAPDDLASPPDEAAAARERDEEVRRALAQIPKRYREVLELRRDRGLDNAEISAHLGISETATRTLICRARRHLLERIDSHRSGDALPNS